MLRTMFQKLACMAVLLVTVTETYAGTVLFDDFDPGLDSNTFQSFQNAAALGAGQPGFLSGNAFHFGRQNGIDPFAITNLSTYLQAGRSRSIFAAATKP